MKCEKCEAEAVYTYQQDDRLVYVCLEHAAEEVRNAGIEERQVPLLVPLKKEEQP